MAKAGWNADDIPEQSGRVAVVTGAGSGIGQEAARVLAGKNASVIIAARNVPKGEEAAESIRREYPSADVAVRKLDLADLTSVEAFADTFQSRFDRLDILINNAGVMMCPYATTRDGFEIQMGTNHLGHFALTGRLIPLLRQTGNSRVVVLSSQGHRRGDPDFSDLNWERLRYKTGQAYCDSKLANLYFAYELARRLKDDNDNPLVTAAHPGWTATELQRHSRLFNFLNRFFAQGVGMGALPTLRAAIDSAARPGDYYGPADFSQLRGYPIRVDSSERSHEVDAARDLWARSEELTGITYP